MAIKTVYSDQELPGEDWQQTETTCPYCGVGCGVTAVSAENEVMPVSGTANHPANLGRLCVKGSALQETLSAEGRLLLPSIKTGDGFKNISWERSLDLISDKLQQVLNTHGPEAVAFYGAGQLLTEDYYVANK
ncbi:molybdopterin-dependent oxidoreductase, partial [Thalassolituus sp. UBA6592]|uniref:molybdopterin-dependent oxidoreductase n=2 Tax=unclassified Thalassolituus TaxID=2624967 RepID=UPI0025D856B4